LELEHKQKRFEGVCLAEFISDWINYELPFIMNPGSLWKTFGICSDKFMKLKGDLKKILQEVLQTVAKEENTIFVFTGLNNLFNVVEKEKLGLIVAFFNEILGNDSSNGFVFS